MASRPRSTALLLVTVLVVAANMRPTITSVGPVLDRIGADTGLDAGALGLLGSIPVLAFAIVSPFVHALSRRMGAERAVPLAIVVLVVATGIRSLPLGGAVPLWIGTALIGASIAVANVLAPAIVKADFPQRAAVVTGAYTAALSGVAALASGVAHPLAVAFDWRIAIGCWAGLAVIAGLVWALRLGGPRDRPPEDARDASAAPSVSVWRSPTAWQLAAFMGLQSTTFYVLITWLPTAEAGTGVSAADAGWHLSVMQLVGVVASLAVTAALQGRGDLRVAAVTVSAAMVLGMVGLLLAPAAALLWVVVTGLASGSSLVVVLTLIAQRAPTAADAPRLSGMVQGVGYLVAAAGPTLAGVLFEATGAWQTIVATVAVAAALQCIPAWLAGRDRAVGAPAPASVEGSLR